MKSWLIKFKISNALNDGRPLAPAVKKAITHSEELRRFAENSSALDHALKSQLPRTGTNGPRHAAIMRAVRAANQASATEKQPAWPRWIAVSIPASLVLLVTFLAIELLHHPSPQVHLVDSQTLAAANSALEVVGRLVREAPAAAWSPMSEEMQRLDRDLVNTKNFLLASLP